MKCSHCGGAMKARRENYLYKECGLPNVTLAGIDVRRCPKCGEHEVVIPRIEQLHRVIAATVAKKISRLTPEEIRFLRKYLGWSGGDFAEHMGIRAETVSRWENGSASMGPAAERLLRQTALTRDPSSDYSSDFLKGVAQQEPKTQRLQLRVRHGVWGLMAA